MGLADGMAWEREHGAPDRPIVAEQQGGVKWFKVSEVNPPEQVTLMVTGDSGYVTRRKFLELAYIDESFRPSRGGELRWLSVQNESLSESGYRPTHWAYPISLP